MLSNEQLTGKNNPGLITLPESLSWNNNQLADPEAVTALLALNNAAEKNNFPFQVISSYRSFEHQKTIWNRKFTGKLPVLDSNEQPVDLQTLSELEIIRSIMLYSALPGASRHHWGTDFDIFPKNALLDGYRPQLVASEFTATGIAVEFNQWLSETLASTEFFRPYKQYQQGIACEPWHISYYPIANVALAQLTVSTLREVLNTESDVTGCHTICANLDSLHQQFINNICSTGI